MGKGKSRRRHRGKRGLKIVKGCFSRKVQAKDLREQLGYYKRLEKRCSDYVSKIAKKEPVAFANVGKVDKCAAISCYLDERPDYTWIVGVMGSAFFILYTKMADVARGIYVSLVDALNVHLVRVSATLHGGEVSVDVAPFELSQQLHLELLVLTVLGAISMAVIGVVTWRAHVRSLTESIKKTCINQQTCINQRGE